MNLFRKTVFLSAMFLVAGAGAVFAGDATQNDVFRGELTALRAGKITPEKALTDDSAQLRQRAAIAFLLESKNPETGAMLEKFLPNAKGQVAVEVMGALAELKRSSALPAIREKLKSDADVGVKTEALICLGFMGVPADVATLLDYVDQPELNDTAVQALFCINGAGTADAFSKIIADSRADLSKRKRLIGIVARRPMRQTVPALAANLTDADETIRNESLKGITRLATDGDVSVLKKVFGEITDEKLKKRVDDLIKKFEKRD